jgi:hypothetical protein
MALHFLLSLTTEQEQHEGLKKTDKEEKRMTNEGSISKGNSKSGGLEALTCESTRHTQETTFLVLQTGNLVAQIPRLAFSPLPPPWRMERWR